MNTQTPQTTENIKIDLTSYYLRELKNVTPSATNYAPTIKVFANGNGQDTNHISLNEQSATALIEWLKENFLTH
jgi:hypothetical protein